MAGLSTLRSLNGFFVQNETPFWNGCHLDSQNVQTSPSQISLIKKSVHTHVQYILTSLLYQKERHHSPQQQYHCSKDNCRRDQITTKTVYTLLGYTFRLALISDFHLIFFSSNLFCSFRRKEGSILFRCCWLGWFGFLIFGLD